MPSAASASPDPADRSVPAAADTTAASVAPSPTLLPSPTSAPAQPPAMDRDFIARNQIVERYLSGRLPLKGAQEFERFCREQPQLLDEIALGDRISAALRLLDASGRPAPWETHTKRWWERLPLLLGVTTAALILALSCLFMDHRLASGEQAYATLAQRARLQPLEAAQSTSPITLIPSRTGPMSDSMVAIGGGPAQMAALKFDLSWSAFTSFRVTIDRIDQGRVGVLHNMLRDSAGNVQIELNSSALGPGDYRFTIEGLTWRGDPVPQAWATISIVR